MADKLKQGVNVLTTFVEGETPTGAKLNSITAQLRNASQQLEKAVGDIHGGSYPYSSSNAARLSTAYGQAAGAALAGAETRSLDIASLARLIGPASALNPLVVEGDLEITEDVPPNVTEFSLQYPPEDPTAVTFSQNGVGEAFETPRTTVVSLAAAGEYYVDTLGRVFCTQKTRLINPGTVTYTINRSSWSGGPNYEGSRFNVIPDPNQLSAGGSGCIVGPADTQGRRPVALPVAAFAQFNHSMDSIELDDADPNYQYQLVLPQVLTENYVSGDLIPAGFLVLKNWTTGEVYDRAEYTYISSTSVLIGGVDITTEVDRGDDFCVVTVGTDIATSIDDLRRKMRHGHDRSFGEPLVPASAIAEWTVGPWGSKGTFTASTISGNYAPQYLHRYGYQSGENPWNDANVMRGDLVLGVDLGPSNYVAPSTGALPADSFKLAFGHPDRSYLYDEAAGPFWVRSYKDLTAYAGRDLVLESVDDWSAVAGGHLEMTSGSYVNFWFNNNVFTEYCAKQNSYIAATGTDKAWIKHNIANRGNGGSDGWAHVTGLGFGYRYEDDTDPTAMGSSTGGGYNSTYQFSVDGLSDSVGAIAVISDRSGPSTVKLLELNMFKVPSNSDYYVQFTGWQSGGYDIYGSIRGTDTTSDTVFYSWHSGIPMIAATAGSLSVTAQAVGHVKFVSGGADYGEWIQAGNPEEWNLYFSNGRARSDTHMGLPEGLVVYVREGKFYRSPGGTPMVITNRAIVVGNLKEGQWPVDECEVLSFVGQVPVFCLGFCADGDLLIPSEEEPNAVVAVDPEACTFAQYKRAIGTAWSSSEIDEIKMVMCAIGKK